MASYSHFLLLFFLILTSSGAYGDHFSKSVTNDNSHRRMKREWIWNKMHIPEEQNGTLPQHVGKITSTVKNPNAKYVLEGEGAGSLFRVDEFTGDVSVSETLDREKKAEYELTALIFNRLTNQQLEEPSKFRIIVHDINDNAPVFVQKVFNGSVVEMSPIGTSVTKVTAVDSDDPTLHGHADVFYEVTDGKNYFRIDSSGTIYTAVPDLDREQKATYTIQVKARDGKGLHAEELGTATVIIKLIDINDNFPTFKQKNFTFEVPENVSLNGEVGRLKVEDIDEPENRDTKYSFRQGHYQDTFKIIPNRYTNEGIIQPTKPLDFEKIPVYRFVVEATDANINYAYSMRKSPESIASVIIKVIDVDEPPVFTQPSYTFTVQEEGAIKMPVGCVSASDPDKAKRKISYHILRSTSFEISTNGCIFATKRLDREENTWHNITVAANELDQNKKVVPRLETHVPVYIKVTDINDNAPEFAFPYDPRVCENAAPGQVIIRISATDKDEMSPDVKFKFFLTSEDSNFTLIGNHDNTANVTVKFGEFNRELVKTHFLPIIISDNGAPPQTSTNTLTLRVCKCDEEGDFTFCEEPAKLVGVGLQVLLAILFCIFTILALTMLLIVWRRGHKKDLSVLRKNEEEIHEQLVAYDEEGGGEMDTTSYDVSVLNSVRQRSITSPRMTREASSCNYPQVQKIPENGLSGTGEMGIMIEMKKYEADNDGDLLPYDTLHIFGYEGAESIAESLSSLGSGSSDLDIDYDFLNDWGPRFKMLAELYGLEPNGDLVY
ncbi:cadherin-5 [Python bivittatus]|uniref:Cadherin-5 n=1 Tax=Python bivittatus TaxID=176946 RepID=A0A9F5MT45_PYTBI|nr:cadherin-5 [Python bivittatus]XP_025025021.1 cadherin-5 [Python bivittatus]XP_025025024.1 cadherin-5 [Python bivittatus]